MSLHRVWLAGFPDQPGSRVIFGGLEAHHAVRVRRITAGDSLELLDGKGRIGLATVRDTRRVSRHGEWEVELELKSCRTTPPDYPRVEVLSAVPKGDRLEQLIDGLAQVGAAAWGPLTSLRTIVEPRDGKLARMERVSHEAGKQCGRAWELQILPGRSLDEAIQAPELLPVLADASGQPYHPTGAQFVRLLVGPEGGWSPQELHHCRSAGLLVASFGVHTMRIETAAVLATGIIMHTESHRRP